MLNIYMYIYNAIYNAIYMLYIHIYMLNNANILSKFKTFER